MLVGLGELQGGQEPDIELVANLSDCGLRDRRCNDRVRAERQMWAVLFDCPEWLDDDAAIRETLADLWAGEIGEVTRARCHERTLPAASIGQNGPVTTPDYDAMVIGAGHNGLVCAAYLAKAGMRTLLVEARSSVGGTASSELFAGGMVNICNCDHITFRTTPVIEELGLADYGLLYIDIDPAQRNLSWDGGPPWTIYHDVEQTIDSLARTYPAEVDGYRRYLKAALPAVRMVLDNANDPPSVATIARKVVARRGRGAATLLRWSRRSAADVMRSYFSEEALRGPAMVTGPMVWGVSPELTSTGLGALTYAIRHVGRVGRPVGGSGMVPESLRRAFEATKTH